MIEYNLDTEHSILQVQPKSAIEQDDFVNLAKAVDPHIEATGGLAGPIIDAPSFPPAVCPRFRCWTILGRCPPSAASDK